MSDIDPEEVRRALRHHDADAEDAVREAYESAQDAYERGLADGRAERAAPTCDSFEWMQFQNLLWDAINRYATSCGGDPSDRVYGNTSRQQAVASVNDAVRDFVCLPDTTTPHKRPCGECHLRPGERCDICGALRCDTAGCENAAVKALCRPHLIGTTTPDVQAQACSHCGAPDTRLRCEWGTGCSPMITEVSDVQAQIDAAVADCERRCATQLADHISRAADDERVRIDAAVAAERERQCVDAAAFRLLREEADAADAWHADTGMKVARPPRMSPATVKHIRDAEIRACSGAQGELRCS